MTESTGLIKRDQYITRYEPQDFDGLARLSQAVVRSGLAPRSIKSPEDAMVILMTGAELGLTAMQSLRSIHVVQGQPTMAADLMKALVLSSGECAKWEYEEKSKRRCRAVVQRKGSAPAVYEWTMEDAKAAGLLGNPTWQKYPSQMLRHRVDSDAARGEFPHLILGIYTPDEIEPGAVVELPTAKEPDAPAPAPGQPDEEIVDAEFEEAPPKPAATGPTTQAEPRSMRADSHTKQFDEYDAIRRHEAAERERAKAKEEWTRHNKAIHAQLAGIDEAWLRAFHDFITSRFKVEQWNDLTAEQLAMTRKRLDGQKSAIAWVKETCGEYLPSPAADTTPKNWAEISELIHEVTGKDSDRFYDYVQGIYARAGVDSFAKLTDAQLRAIWGELNRRPATAPNGGSGGEVSPREIWLAELADKVRVSQPFDDSQIPF